MAPIFKKLAKEYGDKVQFAKLNTDQNLEIAFNYEVAAVPTFLLLHKGTLVKTEIGAIGEPGLRRLLALIK